MSVYDNLIMNNHSDKIKGIHMKKTKEQHNERKKEIMEKCFECYAENGLTGTGIKALAAACNCTTGNLYCYFKNIDELILESTAYCMTKVEDDFMEKAPTNFFFVFFKLFKQKIFFILFIYLYNVT